jgi:hypothetical protein
MSFQFLLLYSTMREIEKAMTQQEHFQFFILYLSVFWRSPLTDMPIPFQFFILYSKCELLPGFLNIVSTFT